MRSHPALLTSYSGFNLFKPATCNLLVMLLCYCSAIFNICAVTKYSRTNLLCTNLAYSSLPSPSFSLLLVAASCVCPPFSESQAPWLFQSPTRSKPSLGSTTPAAPVGSCHSKRVRPCFCTSERLMTGGRDDTTEWTDWCHISTLWSKTCKMCSYRLS